MNKKGFTLVEVLAVVILFGILITIVVSLVDVDLTFAKKFASDSQVRLLEDSAILYYQNYKSEIPTIDTNNIVTVTVSTLLDKGYIKEKDLKINEKTNIDNDHYVILYLIDREIYAKYDSSQSTKPIIALKGPKELKIRTNSTYYEYGAVILNTVASTVINLHHANIFGGADIDTNTEGVYEVIYTYPNAITVKRFVTVEKATTNADTNKPTIILNGNAVINMVVGGSYVEQGASATDIEDGNISARLTTSGKVNTTIRGTYYIYYDVSDKAGNKADTITRTINVN